MSFVTTDLNNNGVIIRLIQAGNIIKMLSHFQEHCKNQIGIANREYEGHSYYVHSYVGKEIPWEKIDHNI